MLRILADESLSGLIVRGLMLEKPDLDIVRVQDVGLSGADDPAILEWAARERRVIITHDAATFSVHAYDRVAAGSPMPGVFQVSDSLPIGQAIEEILIVAECSEEGEWEGQVRHLPLQPTRPKGPYRG